MRSFCLLVSMMSAFALVVNGQIAYYVERNGVIKPVVRGDSEKERPYQWQVRLYRLGVPKSGPGWGQIIGQSADDAMEELHRSRDFQLRMVKFCKSYSQNENQTLTYSNVLGPVAMYEKNADDKKTNGPGSWRSDTYDLADRISELEKEFLAVTEEKRVRRNPSRYPFAPASAPWNFAQKLVETKRQFEQLNAAAASAGRPPSRELTSNQSKIKYALTDLETNLLPPMKKSLANLTFEGAWKHGGMSYVASQSGNQLSFKTADPDGLHFRNITVDGTKLSGEIQFIYDNGCEPVWVSFTAELTFDTDMEGILISAPRVGREKTTCKQVTQGILRMMFWRPEQ